MARPFKLLMILVGLVLLVAIGAVIAVIATFDPNDYRSQIAGIVKDKTGRELQIGDIGLSVFPWIKVDLSAVSLSNAPGFGEQPFAEVGKAKVGVELMPLLRQRKIVVDGLQLDGLVLNLARNAEGKTNWEDLVKKEDKPDEPETPEDESKFKLEDIDIGGIEITKAAIRYQDDQAKQAYQISDFNLKTGALKPGKAFDIETSVKAALEAQKLNVELKLSTHVDPDLDTQDIELSKLKLEAKLSGAQQGEAKFEGDIKGNLKTQAFELPKLTLDVKGKSGDIEAEATLKGSIKGDMISQQIDVSGLDLDAKGKQGPMNNGQAKLKGAIKANLQTQVFDLTGLDVDAKGKYGEYDIAALLKTAAHAELASKLFTAKGLTLNATVGGKAVPGGTQKVDLTVGDVKLDQAKGSGQVSSVLLKAAGLEASTSLAVSALDTDTPRFSGPLEVKPFNARELIAKFSAEPLKTADAKALTSVSLSSRIDGSTKSLKLDDLLLKLDQSTVSGSLNLRDFASMALGFALKIDSIDADRYLPPVEPPPANQPAKPYNAAELNKTEIPLDALNDLDVDGTLSIGKLKIKGTNLSDVRLDIAGPKGAAKQASLAGKLYGGSFTANTRIAPGPHPSYAIKTSLQSLSLGPALKDFMGDDKVTGVGTVNLDITTAGKTVGDVRKALNGDVSLNFKNGAVKGFNLGEMLRKGKAMLAGQQYVAPAEPVETDFAVIDFSGKIVNGVLKSDSLDARNPLLRVGGSGEIDLVNETFNYTAKPTIVESSKGQGGRGLEDLGGLTVPIKLTGTFSAPKYKIDFKDMAKERAKAEVKQQLDVRKEELQQKLNDKYGDKLNQKLGPELAPALEGLFGKKKKKDAQPPAQEQPQQQPSAPAEQKPAEQKKEESAPSNP
ncbi:MULTISPECIES: AsmA family protein [Hydrocarboniphaga]|nr:MULTISPECIES: AsmA family protein [Hydrocarboniphaga]MDZ4077611.1 AsmA family protein [Hydrocarboniphaga sp.]